MPRQGVCRRCPQRAILVGLHYLTHYGVSPRPFLPQDKESFFEKHRTQKKRFSFSRSLRVFPPLVRVSYHFTSPGERKVVTPRKYNAIFFVRCNASVAFLVLGLCLLDPPKTFAGIARVRRPRKKRSLLLRRLRTCPRKASTWSDPGRREMHVLIEKNPAELCRSLYQLRELKATTLFNGKSNRKCLRWGEHLCAVPVPKLTKKAKKHDNIISNTGT